MKKLTRSVNKLSAIIMVILILATMATLEVFGVRFNLRETTREKLESIIAPSEIGERLQSINANSDRNDVIAVLNSNPIYAREYETYKFFYNISREYSVLEGVEHLILPEKTDEEMLIEVAKIRIMNKELEEAGIYITREDAIEKMKFNRKQIKSLAESGYESAINGLKDDEAMYASLSVTEEEFIYGIGAELELQRQVTAAYIVHYHERAAAGINGYPQQSYESYGHYLDAALDKSDLSISSEFSRSAN